MGAGSQRPAWAARTLPRNGKGSPGADPDGPGQGSRSGTDGEWHGPALRDSGRGRWERPRTGPLDGGCPEPARLSAADGGLRAALQPGAHVRARGCSPSRPRARGSVPSPAAPGLLPAPPSGPQESLHTTQPNPAAAARMPRLAERSEGDGTFPLCPTLFGITSPPEVQI